MTSNPPDPPPGMILEAKMVACSQLDRIATCPVEVPLIAGDHLLALNPYGRFTDEDSDLLAVWCTWHRSTMSIGFARFVPVDLFNDLVPLSQLLQPVPDDVSSLVEQSEVEETSALEILSCTAVNLAHWWTTGSPRRTTQRFVQDASDQFGELLAEELSQLAELLSTQHTTRARRALVIEQLERIAAILCQYGREED